MIKRKLFILFALIFPLFLLGQSDQTTTYTQDTILFNTYNDSLEKVMFRDFDRAAYYIDVIEAISNKINYRKGLYLVQNFKGIILYMKGNYQESIPEYSKALPYTNKDVPYQRARTYLNISLSYKTLGQYDSAIYYLDLAGDLAEKYHLYKLKMRANMDRGALYLKQEDFVNAANFLLKDLDQMESKRDTISLTNVYGMLALLYKNVDEYSKSKEYFKKVIALDVDGFFLTTNYFNLGSLYYQNLQSYDSAIYFYNKGLSYSSEIKKEVNLLTYNTNMGSIMMDQGKIDSSFVYYNKAYHSPVFKQSPNVQAAIFTNFGLYYYNKAKYQQAQKFLAKGLALSKEMGYLNYQTKAYKTLYRLAESKKNWEQAFKYSMNYNELTDSLQKEEAAQLTAKIDFDRYMVKEKFQNELLQKENSVQQQNIFIQRIIIIFVILLALTLLILLLFVSKSKKRIKVLLEELNKTNSILQDRNSELLAQKTEMKDLLMTKDRFVSIIGHDLKNPFSGLLGMLELLHKDWKEMKDEDKRHSIKLLYDTSAQTYTLLEELLSWGKTQEGLVKSHPESFHINDVLVEVHSVFSMNLKKKEVALNIDADPETEVYADRKLLSQILQNFLGNAIKYSHPKDEIYISVKKQEEKILICVQDHGIGIPSDKLDQLFELDSHFNRPGTQNEKSSGMGLILSKEYAHIMGAKISVTSEEGKGSHFCVTC